MIVMLTFQVLWIISCILIPIIVFSDYYYNYKCMYILLMVVLPLLQMKELEWKVLKGSAHNETLSTSFLLALYKHNELKTINSVYINTSGGKNCIWLLETSSNRNDVQ